MNILKRLNKLLPIILSGIIYGIAWYVFDNKVFHAAVIATIWMDKALIARDVKKLASLQGQEKV